MDTAKLSISQRLHASLEGVYTAYLEQLPSATPVESIWLGCSGGLDSVALLEVAVPWAKARDLTLHIIHVNHQLSRHSNDWQQHVVELANAHALAVTVESVSVQRQPRKSLEDVARQARYSVFAKQVKQHGLLLLAHHRNDQIETLMMRFLRGSGPKGLAGMQTMSERTVGEQTFFLGRPFLSVSRTELEDYAAQRDLTWVEDESNQNSCFDRNFIRNGLFPVMAGHWQKRWEGMQVAMLRTSQLCAEQQQSLEFLLAEKLAESSCAGGALSRTKLTALPHHLANNLLRYWLQQHKIVLPSQAILQQIQQLLLVSNDSQGRVTWGSNEVRVFKDKLFAFATPYKALECNVVCTDGIQIAAFDALGLSFSWHIKWLSNALALTADTGVSLELSMPHVTAHEDTQLCIRNNISEHYFTLNAQQKAKPLKVWFKEWEIPTWHRSSVLGVFANQQLLSVLIDANTVHVHARVASFD